MAVNQYNASRTICGKHYEAYDVGSECKYCEGLRLEREAKEPALASEKFDYSYWLYETTAGLYVGYRMPTPSGRDGKVHSEAGYDIDTGMRTYRVTDHLDWLGPLFWHVSGNSRTSVKYRGYMKFLPTGAAYEVK